MWNIMFRDSSMKMVKAHPAPVARHWKQFDLQLRVTTTLLSVALAVLIGACSPPTLPAVTVQNADYANVRNEFRTVLLRKGPAPQEWGTSTPGPGVTEVQFESSGNNLKAWLSHPTDKSKHRGLVFLHGGCSFENGDWAMTEPFQKAGYAVLTPMLRGENGQKGNFSFLYDEVGDVLAATEYLCQQPEVDAGNIFVAGHSFGGTLALLSAMATNRFRAGVAFSACPDVRLYLQSMPEMGVFDTRDPREILVRSPYAYAASFKCPIRMIYGSEEPGLDLPTRLTVTTASQHGLDVGAIVVPGRHADSPSNGMKQALEFFGQH